MAAHKLAAASPAPPCYLLRMVREDKETELARLFARLNIREEDLVEKFIRASGPGGQKVNKTSSAVYLHHLPSGIEIKAQTSRSQALNRFQARRLLAQRLLEQLEGKRSAAAQARAKIQRQKRRRSRRAKARTVADKRQVSKKKSLRGAPKRED